MTLVLSLAHATVLIDPINRIVSTRFPDSRECVALREDNDQNRIEAEDEGYTGEDAVWRCLQDHEVLHSLCADWLWHKASPTLRHEAGAERVVYARRLGEEALVIAFQTWMNTGEIFPVLNPFAEQLTRWRVRYTRAMENIREEAA